MTIPRIRIGNQTAFSASEPMMPLEFALAHRFDAFEWFNDKRHGWGWSQDDVDEAERRRLRETAERHDMAYSVHASCQASLCQPAGQSDVLRTIDFARDIGARLVNIYYHGDRGPEPFVDALVPVLAHAHTAGVRVSIENSVFSSPDDFNRLFELLARKSGVESQCAGLCYDMGHANLCIATRNDYLHFLDWPFALAHLPGLAGKVAYAQFLHDGSEVGMKGLEPWQTSSAGKAGKDTLALNLPIRKPDAEIPVIELFLK